MAERVLEYEVTFAFRCKTLNGGRKRIERCLAFRCSARGIRKTEEKNRGGEAAMKRILTDDAKKIIWYYSESGFPTHMAISH